MVKHSIFFKKNNSIQKDCIMPQDTMKYQLGNTRGAFFKPYSQAVLDLGTS